MVDKISPVNTALWTSPRSVHTDVHKLGEARDVFSVSYPVVCVVEDGGVKGGGGVACRRVHPQEQGRVAESGVDADRIGEVEHDLRADIIASKCVR